MTQGEKRKIRREWRGIKRKMKGSQEGKGEISRENE